MGFLRGTKAEIIRLLQEGPRHGYGLARQLKLTLSTVYEHLEELEADGLIISERRGNRRQVRLTAQGKVIAAVLGERTGRSKTGSSR